MHCPLGLCYRSPTTNIARLASHVPESSLIALDKWISLAQTVHRGSWLVVLRPGQPLLDLIRQLGLGNTNGCGHGNWHLGLQRVTGADHHLWRLPLYKGSLLDPFSFSCMSPSSLIEEEEERRVSAQGEDEASQEQDDHQTANLINVK